MAISFLERLNTRERRLVTVLGTVLSCFVILAVPFALESVVHAREADNQELATALTALQDGRAHVRERQEQKEALVQRYAKKAPPLAGFVEQAAQAEKLEVTDSVDRPEVPHGKRYTERGTTVRLRKAGLKPIVMFLEALEKSGFPIEVSRLSLRKRLGEPDSYDVEVTVSAYDHVGAAPAAASTPAPEKRP
jgi:general secretion pathway protein M